jgi:hypothetical protein
VVVEVGGGIAAGLERVRDAFGMALETEVDGGNGVGDDAGPIFNGGNESLQAFFKAAGQERMLGLLVLGEIGKARLLGEKRKVVRGAGGTAKAEIEEMRWVPGCSGGQQGIFDESTAFQEGLGADFAIIEFGTV